MTSGIVSKWQPIETAPTHTSIILCCWWKFRPDAAFVSEGYKNRDSETWCWQNGEPIGGDHTQPTHWQPLPAPPSRT